MDDAIRSLLSVVAGLFLLLAFEIYDANSACSRGGKRYSIFAPSEKVNCVNPDTQQDNQQASPKPANAS
ncbi:hypothetical protein [Corticibacter populi]|uniref:hypothetical protein n=1 Tax=Corticibacter populi TaxID=1550736 RepID=UPI00102C31C4|nr:hypothetical protein [Corticibacter populi]